MLYSAATVFHNLCIFCDAATCSIDLFTFEIGHVLPNPQLDWESMGWLIKLITAILEPLNLIANVGVIETR